MSTDNEMVVCTEFNTSKFTFTWIIKDYSLVIKDVPGECLTSPEFSLGVDAKRKFNLHLYPGGNNENNSQFISLFLFNIMKNDETTEFMCKCTFSILTQVGGSSIYEMTFDKKFIEKTTFWGWSKFYEKKNYQKLITKDASMIICCKLSVSSGHKTSIISNGNFTAQKMIDKLKFDFLFLNEELSDFKIKTFDESDIPVHKTILAAASPVFKAMFTHEMLENKNNSVEIMDTPRNIIIVMLRYIYTGQIETTGTDIILELLEAAEKYQISNLKIKCGQILCVNLSTTNAIDILLAAYKYNEKDLKNEAAKFVSDHIKLFIDSTRLKLIDDPEIFINLMQSMIKSQESIS